MKYILLILYRVLKFIFFCILHILTKLLGVVWLGKLKYNPNVSNITSPNDIENGYRHYYVSFWDAALGRKSFHYRGWSYGNRPGYRIYPHSVQYPHTVGHATVKGKTKLFTYKV